MREPNDRSDAPAFLKDNTNGSQKKRWGRLLTIVSVVAVSLGILVFGSTYIQPFINHKPALKFTGYSSVVLSAVGIFSLSISSIIAKSIDKSQNKLDYITAFIGTVLLYPSLFGLMLITHKPEYGWWHNVSPVILLTGLIALTFSDLVDKKQRRLSNGLRAIGSILGLFGLIVSSLLDT